MMRLKYVDEIMKRVLMIEGSFHFSNEKSLLFLKAADITHDHEVMNGEKCLLLISEHNAEKLEEFYRHFFRLSLAQLFEMVSSDENTTTAVTSSQPE